MDEGEKVLRGEFNGPARRASWRTDLLEARVRKFLEEYPGAGRWALVKYLGLSSYQAEVMLRKLKPPLRRPESPPPERLPEADPDTEYRASLNRPVITLAEALAECDREGPKGWGATLADGLELKDPFPEAVEIKVLRPTRLQDWETAVVLGDLHRPYHDKAAVELVEAFLEKLQPDRLYLDGDIVDFYAVSRFDKDPRRMAAENLREEVVDTRAWLRNLRCKLQDARIIYVEGNHEFRLRKYINTRAPELSWLDELTVEGLLGLRALGVEYVSRPADKFIDTFARWGDLLVGHFDIARGDSAATARALLTKYGLSLIQGHCHSVGAYNRTLETGMVKAWENGCLCSLEPHYVRPAAWAHAFAVVHKEREGRLFQVEPVLMVKRRFRYGGELWAA